jgi:hypothetical protein
VGVIGDPGKGVPMGVVILACAAAALLVTLAMTRERR